MVTTLFNLAGESYPNASAEQAQRAGLSRFLPRIPRFSQPLERIRLEGIKDNLDAAAELQQVAGVEVDEQQPGTRIEQQVAQGIEKPVTGKVWNRQAIAINAHETGLAPCVPPPLHYRI